MYHDYTMVRVMYFELNLRGGGGGEVFGNCVRLPRFSILLLQMFNVIDKYL